jgi:hypothetical protein
VGRGRRAHVQVLRLKRVFTAANLPEAHLLAHHLADRGVRTQIFNANASSIAGELPIDAALPQLWVERDDDAARARTLIDEYFRARVTGPPVHCPKCGEENPASFDLCWNCGTGLER